MTLADICNEYLEGKRTAINTIRTMSGMFNPDHAVGLLTIICQITRMEEGDLDKETFKELYLNRKVQ